MVVYSPGEGPSVEKIEAVEWRYQMLLSLLQPNQIMESEFLFCLCQYAGDTMEQR